MAPRSPTSNPCWTEPPSGSTDLAGTVAQLRRNGVRFRSQIITGAGGKQIIAEDPSGNPVELFEPALPESRLR